MPSLRQDIVQWLSAQDYWVRFLGNAILHKGCIDESDEKSAFGYLLQENGLAEKTPEVPLASIAASVITTEVSEPVVFAGMKDLKNVNALAPGQELTFGNGITAIYGQNGVGKSGYTRMLNNAFRSRGDTEILPDVRSKEETGQPACTFLFLKQDEELPLPYPDDSDHPYFRSYTVFDTKSMRVHVDKENHLHFSPQGFEFFDELAAAVDSLKEKLQSTIAQRRTENSFTRHFEGKSPVTQAIAGLSGSTDLNKLRKSAEWTDADGNRKKALTEKLVSLQPAQVEKITLNTGFITRMQRPLFEKYVTEDYRERFVEECKRLDADRFGVEVVQKGAKGRTRRSLRLGGYEPGRVLSEGEQRAIALADFLTEAIMDPANCGIILDDPVNSLDHVRKEQIASRLAEEAKARQVIIFTHDLVFLYMLKNAAEWAGAEYICHWMQCCEGAIGNVFLNNSPSTERDYHNHRIAMDWWEKARKAAPSDQEHLLKQGFGALRTTYETFVIHTLFNDVVKRFDERVSFGRLKEIRLSPEILTRVDEKCSLLSRYIEGHSHSDKYIHLKPTPEKLKEEIDDFIELTRMHKALQKGGIRGKEGIVPQSR